MRVSLRKQEHIEALVREEGPLGSEDVSKEGNLNFENDDSELVVKILFH
jgi:hypothetical protein